MKLSLEIDVPEGSDEEEACQEVVKVLNEMDPKVALPVSLMKDGISE